MIDIFETAKELQEFCDRNGWRSCFIGGIAVLRWGEPRVTRDVDLTLLTGFGAEDDFIVPLLNVYQARMENARDFARRYRVLLLTSPGGVGIDISLGALPFEEALIGHATPFCIGPSIEIRTCSAEDLIVLKLFALRPLDIHDAESVAIRQKSRLNWDYIEGELRPLAEVKDQPEILRELARLREL